MMHMLALLQQKLRRNSEEPQTQYQRSKEAALVGNGSWQIVFQDGSSIEGLSELEATKLAELLNSRRSCKFVVTQDLRHFE